MLQMVIRLSVDMLAVIQIGVIRIHAQLRMVVVVRLGTPGQEMGQGLVAILSEPFAPAPQPLVAVAAGQAYMAMARANAARLAEGTRAVESLRMCGGASAIIW